MQIKNMTSQPRGFHLGPTPEKRRIFEIAAGATIEVPDGEFKKEISSDDILKGWLDRDELVVVGPRITVQDAGDDADGKGAGAKSPKSDGKADADGKGAGAK